MTCIAIIVVLLLAAGTAAAGKAFIGGGAFAPMFQSNQSGPFGLPTADCRRAGRQPGSRPDCRAEVDALAPTVAGPGAVVTVDDPGSWPDCRRVPTKWDFEDAALMGAVEPRAATLRRMRWAAGPGLDCRIVEDAEGITLALPGSCEWSKGRPIK